MPKSRQESKIFISYSRHDLARAREAYRRLTLAGFDPWLDLESIPAGSQWKPYIERAIAESRIVLILLSTHSVTNNGFAQREIHSALAQWQEKAPGEIYIVPARLDDCPRHERLAHLSWIDLFDETGWTRLIAQLRQLHRPNA